METTDNPDGAPTDSGAGVLMILGGLHYLRPAIEAAHRLGVRVVTVDNCPDNPAHLHSDAYRDVSVCDADAVAMLASEMEVNGIMSFAVDPGVESMLYACHRLRLPSPCRAPVSPLAEKSAFRSLLGSLGLNVPRVLTLRSGETVTDRDLKAAGLAYPVVVKPVDSAGSKGVSVADCLESLREALAPAWSRSRRNTAIVETFLPPLHHPSDSEVFVIDGEIAFCSFSNQYFDTGAPNPLVPAAYAWPSDMPAVYRKRLHDDLSLLMRREAATGLFNVETRVAADGRHYIMEAAPRGGGNRIAELLDRYAGSHLVENSVRAALGMPLVDCGPAEPEGVLAEVILHSNTGGTFRSVEVSEEMERYVVERDIWVRPGDRVQAFSGADCAIGTLVLLCPDAGFMYDRMERVAEWCRVIVE